MVQESTFAKLRDAFRHESIVKPTGPSAHRMPNLHWDYTELPCSTAFLGLARGASRYLNTSPQSLPSPCRKKARNGID